MADNADDLKAVEPKFDMLLKIAELAGVPNDLEYGQLHPWRACSEAIFAILRDLKSGQDKLTEQYAKLTDLYHELTYGVRPLGQTPSVCINKKPFDKDK